MLAAENLGSTAAPPMLRGPPLSGREPLQSLSESSWHKEDAILHFCLGIAAGVPIAQLPPFIGTIHVSKYRV